MVTSKATIESLLHALHAVPQISARAMFGEYALYCGAKVIALVCDDTLYLKVTPQGEALIGAHQKGPPYPGAKQHIIISEDRWDDAKLLHSLVTQTAAVLPEPKPKKPKSASR
jgi:DNA transformation protein and related proteins